MNTLTMVLIGAVFAFVLMQVWDKAVQSRANDTFFESLDLHRKSISALMDIVKAQQSQIDELAKQLTDSPKS